MLVEEFTARTGYKPTPEEYKTIEAQYYEFDGDKTAFCQYWQCHNIARRLIMQAVTLCAKKRRGDSQLEAALKEYAAAIGEILF